MTNSADPDQLASSEANWSVSTLFAKTGHVFSKRRVNNRKENAHNASQVYAVLVIHVPSVKLVGVHVNSN